MNIAPIQPATAGMLSTHAAPLLAPGTAAPTLALGGPPPPRDAANIARELTQGAFDLNHAGNGVVDKETPRRMHLMLTDASECIAMGIHFADLHPEQVALVAALAAAQTGTNEMAAKHFTGLSMPPVETRRELATQILAWEQVLRQAIDVLGGVPPVVFPH